MDKVDLFTYRDYRKYLKDWYDTAKEIKKSFSFRAFSMRAGFKSPNFFKLVMDGDRNLTEASLNKFAKGLELNKREQEFFESLVYFNQANGHTEKDFYYQRLMQLQKVSALKVLEQDQYDYYSSWYHPVVRELLISPDSDGTPEWISSRISPPITVAQTKKSIQLLEKLGLIKKNDQDHWEQAESVVTTTPEVQSVTLMNYHLHLLELTTERLAKVPPNHRDISSMTLGIRKELISELKQEIDVFRTRVFKLVSTEDSPEDVLQLNIQLFPLTRLNGNNKNGGDKS